MKRFFVRSFTPEESVPRASHLHGLTRSIVLREELLGLVDTAAARSELAVVLASDPQRFGGVSLEHLFIEVLAARRAVDVIVMMRLPSVRSDLRTRVLGLLLFLGEALRSLHQRAIPRAPPTRLNR
jgi:hypothetical protein